MTMGEDDYCRRNPPIMTKKKPDYTQFMKSPGPLNTAQPPDEEDKPRMSASISKTRPSEDEIPWGEVILDPDPHEEPRPEASPAVVSTVRNASSHAAAPHQSPMSARERVLARTTSVESSHTTGRTDSPRLAAALDNVIPGNYPPIAVMAMGVAMVLLLLFLTGRN